MPVGRPSDDGRQVNAVTGMGTHQPELRVVGGEVIGRIERIWRAADLLTGEDHWLYAGGYFVPDVDPDTVMAMRTGLLSPAADLSELSSPPVEVIETTATGRRHLWTWAIAKLAGITAVEHPAWTDSRFWIEEER
jgi:hypothetical protein